MAWLELVDDAQGVRALFPSGEPSLASVRLHEVTLHQDAATVYLRLDLDEYPKAPPEKWSTRGYNTVQIELALIDARRIFIQGWSPNNVGDLALSAGQNGVAVRFRADSTFVEGEFCSVRLQKVSGYQSTARGPR
jgi:hypothetical protein